MKITRKNLERLIKEEVNKTIEEFDRDQLYHDTSKGPVARAYKGRSIHPEAAAATLMDILAKLSEIEGKIDELSGKPPMNLP